MMFQFVEEELMKVTYYTTDIHMNMMNQFGEAELMKVTDEYDVSIWKERTHESYM